MKIRPYANDLLDYLKEDDVIDYSDESITQLADELYKRLTAKRNT